MKMRNLLVAAVMFLGLTAAAFAQATFSVGSIPVTTVTATTHTGLAGDITFTGTGTTVSGTITIRYGGLSITNPLTAATTPPTAISVTGATINTALSSNSLGLLVLDVPPGLSALTIIVSGVRLSLVGTGVTLLNATISTTGNAITAGQSTVTVINATAAGLGTSAVVTPTTVNSLGVVTVGGLSTITVNEGWNNAWTAMGAGDTQGVGIRVRLSATPPAGVSLSFPETIAVVNSAATAHATPGAFFQRALPMVTTTAVSTAAGPQLISSASTAATALQVFYVAMGTPHASIIEQVRIPVTVSGGATGFTPPAALTVTATLAPIGSAFEGPTGTVHTASRIPRFSEAETTAVTIVSFETATSALLIPFATRITASGFDTGISIANTTRDPGTTALGLTSPTSQTGRITFYIYPQRQADGTLPDPVVFSPASAIAGTTGLDASGNIVAGSTFTGMLSTIFTAAGVTAAWRDTFNGYIFVVCSFTNAHGQYVLSDFRTFSQGALMLVLDGPRNIAREALKN